VHGLCGSVVRAIEFVMFRSTFQGRNGWSKPSMNFDSNYLRSTAIVTPVPPSPRSPVR
jgi:hypothetical protein